MNFATCTGGAQRVASPYRVMSHQCTPLDDFISEISHDCAEEYRRRMRARLMRQPREWLVDQLLEHLADAGTPEGVPYERNAGTPEGAPYERNVGTLEGAPYGRDGVRVEQMRPDRGLDDAARAARLQVLQLDETGLAAFTARCRDLDRAQLESRAYLVAPPPKGADAIDASHRTRKGNVLLRDAKDMLHALLFGDVDEGVRLTRAHRELLTITVPRAKMSPLACLLRAATVIDAEGTWRDPEGRADDEQRHNALLQIEYGEVASEAVGRGIRLALRLINDLELNEQVLYARMENVEESTLT